MVRRTRSWTRILALAGLFVCASSAAFAAVPVSGLSAQFHWNPASGPVVGYMVYLSRNGGAYTAVARVGSTHAFVHSKPGDILRVRVAAIGSDGSIGPYSPMSDPVQVQASPSGGSSSGSSASNPAPTSAPPSWLVFYQGGSVVGGGIPQGPWAAAEQTGWMLRGAADLDGNGTADLLWVNSTGKVWVWLMDGVNLVGGGILNASAPSGWNLVSAADFNGDGHPDLLWRNRSTGQLWVWYMNGLNLLAGATLDPPEPGSWIPAGAGDFNGDGYADIVWRNPTTGQNWIWLLKNFQLIGGGLAPTLSAPAEQLAGVGEFYGGKQADLLWRNSSVGETWLWQMHGVALVGGGLIEDPGPSWRIGAVGDFNGDGFADVLWVAQH